MKVINSKEVADWKRGRLTETALEIAKRHLGMAISQPELRLMPYVHYCLVNRMPLDPNKLNTMERDILADWRERGWFAGGASGIEITRELYTAICEIMWETYVHPLNRLESAA